MSISYENLQCGNSLKEEQCWQNECSEVNGNFGSKEEECILPKMLSYSCNKASMVNIGLLYVCAKEGGEFILHI